VERKIGGRPSRRGLLAAMGAGFAGLGALSGLTGCAPAERGHGGAPDPTATQPYDAGAAPARVVQVLAHPDDDLYFMNPDTLHSLQAGVPVVSVYVTAGESTGVNHEPYEPRHRHRHDRPAYSSARHQGLRQAYATMLGRPHFTPWRRDTLDLACGIRVEVDTLDHATLVFLQVSMHELSATGSLPIMWQQAGATLPYVDAEGAPAGAAGRAVWTHDKLVTALAGLFEQYRPTEVRTLDPDPDVQVHDRTHPTSSDQPGYSDHRDHTATALFAWKALDHWVARRAERDGTVPAFTVTAYRGYYNQRWPFNLPPATVALKGRFLFQYGGDQTWACGNPGGCGDYGQGRNFPLHNPKGWIRSTRVRHPGPRRVVLPAAGPSGGAPGWTEAGAGAGTGTGTGTGKGAGTGTGGARVAYEVLGLRAVRRTETAPGVWGPPQDLGGGPLAPAISAVRDGAGRTLLFALRFSVLEGDGGGDLRDLVVWEEGRGWTPLGTPDRTGDRGRRTGSPVAVTAPDGRVHLFARNAAKGVSTRVRDASGRWSRWRDLGGAEVQEGLAVLADASGRVHVFASGRDTVHHWGQSRPGADVEFRPLPVALPRPSDPPSAVLTPRGAIRLTYPRPASARPHEALLRL
jgi:LmbE family N-acetylglucosaminyl deacetylase